MLDAMIPAATALASFVFGLAGFGLGLVALSLLPFLMPPTTAVPLISVYSAAFALVMSIQLRRDIVFSHLALLLGGALVGTPVGVWGLATLPASCSTSSTAPCRPAGTRTGDCDASSAKKRTSRMYIRSIVEVKTAADAIRHGRAMLLEVVWEALEHAGIPADSMYGSDTGVFVGLMGSDYVGPLGLIGDPEAADDIRDGCYDIHERVRDMDRNGILASMCFPTFVGFSAGVFHHDGWAPGAIELDDPGPGESVTGRFDKLPENRVWQTGGHLFRVSYRDNRVTLTVMHAVPPTAPPGRNR